MALKNENTIISVDRVILLLAVYFLLAILVACYFSKAIPVWVPSKGISGLFDRKICAPLLLFCLLYAFLISFRKLMTLSILYFSAGVFFSISMILALFVSNSGALLVSIVGGIALNVAHRASRCGEKA